LTGVDQEYVDLEGRSTGDAGKPSYVWVKNDGVWKIWVGQNTAVYADESVND
jgi:hypothetical protein